MNLKEWGYTWDGMKEITREQANKQYKEKETFILYDDDTESLIESAEQFNLTNVRYGVEKENNTMTKQTTLYIQEPNSEGFQCASIGGNIVAFKRHGHDINGNPLWKVLPITFLFRHYKAAYRNYEKSSGKSYYLIQSYSFKDDLIKLLKAMDEAAPMSLSLEQLDGWQQVK